MDPIVAMAALRRDLERRLSALEQSAGPKQLAFSLRSVREFVHKLQARLGPIEGIGDCRTTTAATTAAVPTTAAAATTAAAMAATGTATAATTAVVTIATATAAAAMVAAVRATAAATAAVTTVADTTTTAADTANNCCDDNCRHWNVQGRFLIGSVRRNSQQSQAHPFWPHTGRSIRKCTLRRWGTQCCNLSTNVHRTFNESIPYHTVSTAPNTKRRIATKITMEKNNSDETTVAATIQESMDGIREKAMRIASIDELETGSV